MQPYRSLLLTAVAALTAVSIVVTLFAIGIDDVATSETVVGSREVVRVSTGTDAGIEARASIDTGAARSAIDRDLAERLGVDVEARPSAEPPSPEVLATSTITLELAGEHRTVTVAITDRSEQAEPVLVGLDALDGMVVAAGQTDLSTPDAAATPSAVEVLLTARSAAVDPGSLLALLPFAALAVVVLRTLVGVSTVGTFTPVLLTLTFLQTGLFYSFALTLTTLAIGVALEPLLRRQHLPRVARLAALISVAALVMIGLEQAFGLQGAGWGAGFPLVISAALVERIYEVWTAEGLRDALLAAGWTLGVAVMVVPLLLAPPVRLLAATAPWALVLGSLVLSLLAGSYRGLRLTEYVRFRRTAEVGA